MKKVDPAVKMQEKKRILEKVAPILVVPIVLMIVFVFSVFGLIGRVLLDLAFFVVGKKE